MNTTLRLILTILLVLVVGGGLIAIGVVMGRSTWGPNSYGMMGSGSDGNGMMNGGMMNGGMMNGGMTNGGMMNGGMMNGGMMGYAGSSSLYGIKPLSVADARTAVEQYLAGLGNGDLAVGEVMIFANQAYAVVLEKSTGVGAFEVLVDPVTLAVTPEPGPNMMWNAKYSPMAAMMGSGMMGSSTMNGGMMGAGATPQPSANLPVSAEDAVQTAQRYLDRYLPGARADGTPTRFYGYYTIDIVRDGQPVGMLSVNGYTRQVFAHSWNGDFVEKAEGSQG